MIELSMIMAKRLAELRADAGLSLEKLNKSLAQMYGIKISIDSLMNYEIQDAGHRNAYKNQGMRVEYLRCLSQFYGVSSDYLLGISDVRNPDTRVAREYYLKAAEKEKRLSNLRNILEQTADEIGAVLNATP